jgi:hypothetical protein
MKSKQVLLSSLAVLVIAGTVATGTGASAKTSAKAMHITGVVQGVSGTTLKISKKGKVYTVSASLATKVENKKDARIKLNDIKAGDHVRATGTISGQTIAATIIKDRSLK